MLNAVYSVLEQLGYSHPIHPTEVHMPIGLIVGALIFQLLGMLFKRPALAQTAHYCTILAFVFLFPTILLGYMDWQHFYAGASLFPIKVKLVMAGILLVMVFISIVLGHKVKAVSSGVVLTSYIVSFACVVVLGYFGGNLVYGSQPKVAETYQQGMHIFNDNCAGCHPKGGNVIVPGLPIINSVYTKSPEAFIGFIRDPKLPNGTQGPMHSFPPEKISDQQAAELNKYIVHVLGHH